VGRKAKLGRENREEVGKCRTKLKGHASIDLFKFARGTRAIIIKKHCVLNDATCPRIAAGGSEHVPLI